MTATFDRSKYLVKQEIPEEDLSVSANRRSDEPSEETTFDRSKYVVQQSKIPNFVKETGRQIARTGSRVAETIAGLPGDIASLAKTVSENTPEAPQFLKKEPSFIQKKGRELLEKLPTSAQLKERSQQMHGDLTKAQTPLEEVSDEVVSLASSMAIPFKNINSLKGLAKTLGLASGAVGSKEVAKAYGAGEKLQAATEVGTLLLGSMINPKGASDHVTKVYQEAKNALPKGVIIPTTGLNHSLDSLEGAMRKGVNTPTKAAVLKDIKQLQKKSRLGNMEFDELIESYHNINENMNSKKLFDELGKSQLKIARKRFDSLRDVVRDEVEKYGKNYPEFLNKWNAANEGYAAIAKSAKVSDGISRALKSYPDKALLLLGAELYKYPQAVPKTVAAAAAGYSLVKTQELLSRIARSKELQKYYGNVVKNALLDKSGGIITNMKKLKEELDKPEK